MGIIVPHNSTTTIIYICLIPRFNHYVVLIEPWVFLFDGSVKPRCVAAETLGILGIHGRPLAAWFGCMVIISGWWYTSQSSG